eukprot:3249998-Alexandrium_andersonii.AAC.1
MRRPRSLAAWLTRSSARARSCGSLRAAASWLLLGSAPAAVAAMGLWSATSGLGLRTGRGA